MGIFLSADLFTTFLFFELMSLTSFVFVIQTEEPEALRAGETYLAVAVIGGLCTLTGLVLLYAQLGTLSIEQLGYAAANATNRKELWVAGILVLIGFAAKAGVAPLHIWLPTAHPAAPAPASAVLSGILIKTGIYGILVDFAGAGATVPLTGFGYNLAKGVMEEIDSAGFLGIFTGGLKSAAGGIAGAVLFSWLAACVFEPKGK